MILKQISQNKYCNEHDGFSLTEVLITTAIIGSISSIGYPSFVDSSSKSKLYDAKSTILTIPPIIGGYIDATGEAPTTWDDLSSIAAVMTNDGPATGDLETSITLPNSIYNLSIEGPNKSVYTLTAIRIIDKTNDNLEEDEYKYAVKSCFNISNGASDLRSGNLSDITNTLNCG
jgi:prepilin-type N-terminal cleavage/methylation domain-containing protein